MAKDCVYPVFRSDDKELLRNICKTMQPPYKASASKLFKCEAKELRGKWDGYNLLDYIKHVIEHVAGEGKDNKKKKLKFEIGVENALQDRKKETTVGLGLANIRKMVGDGGLQTENAYAIFESLAEAQKISEVQCLHDYLELCFDDGYLVRHFRQTSTVKGKTDITNSPELKNTVDDLQYFLDHWQEIEANEKKSQSLTIDERYLGNGKFSYKTLIGTGADRLAIDDKIDELSVSKVAHLLRWEYGLTKLHGRNNQLAELKEWLDQPADTIPVSIKLIHGEGGVGKTRLAYDFARKCRRRGWNAGAMDKNRQSHFDGDWWFGPKGILLIIDYPEEQKQRTEALIHALHDNFVVPAGKSVRVLLLSRNQSVFDEVVGAMNGAVEPNQMLLKAFNQTGIAWDIFINAWDGIQGNDFKRHASTLKDMPYPIEESEFEAWLERGDEDNAKNAHGTPLIIIALAVYLSDENYSDDKTLLDIKASGLIRELTKREAKRIQEEVSDSPRTIDYQGVLLVKAVAAIANGFDAGEFKALKVHLKIDDIEVGLPTVNDLKALSLWDHKENDNDNNGELPSFKPDILAADFLAYCFEEYAETEEAEWVFAALGMSEIENPNVDHQKVVDNFSRLGRLIHDSNSRLKIRWHWPIEALEYYIESRPEYSMWIALKVGDTVNFCLLPLLVLSVFKTIIFLDLNADEEEYYVPEKARLLSKLSRLLTKLGNLEGALDSAALSTDILKNLAGNNLALYGQPLASSYFDLSQRFSARGNMKEALSFIELALELNKALRDDDDLDNRSEEARYLVEYSNCLLAAEKFEKALEMIETAALIYIELIEHNFEAYAPYYAFCLTSLAVILFHVGCSEDGLAAAGLSRDMFVELAENEFDLFGRYLAQSITNYSNYLVELDRKNEAMFAAEQALEVYQRLCEIDFEEHACSLGVLLLTFCLDHQLHIDKVISAKNIYSQFSHDQSEPWIQQFPEALAMLLKLAEEANDDDAIKTIKQIELEINQQEISYPV